MAQLRPPSDVAEALGRSAHIGGGDVGEHGAGRYGRASVCASAPRRRALRQMLPGTVLVGLVRSGVIF
jgi:hypothetical protein